MVNKPSINAPSGPANQMHLLRIGCGRYPPGCDAVHPDPADPAERGGPVVRARIRPLPRDSAAMIEKVRPPLRGRVPSQASQPHAPVRALSSASRRNVREAEWRNSLPVAGGRPRGRDPFHTLRSRLTTTVETPSTLLIACSVSCKKDGLASLPRPSCRRDRHRLRRMLAG